MRWLVAIGLALLVIVPGAVHADPGAPQLDPAHGRREDAQRLREQLPGVDREAIPAPAPAGPAAPVEPPHSEHETAGAILLCIAGGAGAAAGTLYLAAPSDYNELRTELLVTALATGVAGLTIVLWNRSVQAAPTVTPRAVGLAIAGRL